MYPIPPPDQPYPSWDIVPYEAEVMVTAIGLDETASVEVLATAGEVPLRFNLNKHTKAVREFFRAIGSGTRWGKGLKKGLEYGAYQSKEGVGPYKLTASLVGRDVVEGAHTLVLQGVNLRRAK